MNNVNKIRSYQKGRMKSLQIPEICRQKKNSYFRKIQLQSNVSKRSVLVRRNNYDEGVKRSISFRPNIRKSKGNNTSRKILTSQDSITERRILLVDDIGKKTQRKHIENFNRNKNENNNLRTLQNQSVQPLETKEEIIRNCIQQLQGVLKGIVKKKYTHNNTKHRRVLTQCEDTYRDNRGKQNKMVRQQSSALIQQKSDIFENYVVRIRQSKNKNGQRTQAQTQNTIKNDRKTPRLKIKDTVQINRTVNQQPKLAEQKKHVKSIQQNEIECSSIDKINQSSFLSDNGKNIIKEVPDQFFIANQKSNKKKIRVAKGFSKVKMNFPHDFFC